MTDDQFADKFQRVLLLLGMGTHIILSSNVKQEDKDWWAQAIEDVVYKNKPIPKRTKDLI